MAAHPETAKALAFVYGAGNAKLAHLVDRMFVAANCAECGRTAEFVVPGMLCPCVVHPGARDAPCRLHEFALCAEPLATLRRTVKRLAKMIEVAVDEPMCARTYAEIVGAVEHIEHNMCCPIRRRLPATPAVFSNSAWVYDYTAITDYVDRTDRWCEQDKRILPLKDPMARTPVLEPRVYTYERLDVFYAAFYELRRMFLQPSDTDPDSVGAGGKRRHGAEDGGGGGGGKRAHAGAWRH